MIKEHAIMIDPILKEIAVNIFGVDMIDDVFSCVNVYRASKDDEIYRSLEKNLCVVKSNTIDFDAKDIVIKFRNGKTIHVSSSEWGSIRQFDIEKDAVTITNEEV
jgi:hypothetical protein